MPRDIRGKTASRIWSIWMLGMLAALGGGTGPAVAQTLHLKLGVLTDMSSLYADNGGQGSVVAAQMAVDDFGGAVLGRKVEVISADHQNKADIGGAITRRWIENENVEVILDVPNSAVALAVQGITRDKKKLFLATGAATSRLTGMNARRPASTGPTIPMRCRKVRPRQYRDSASRIGISCRRIIRSARNWRPTVAR
jgi:ABC-type branched-subunit amino acid transport system substrate-binding protein